MLDRIDICHNIFKILLFWNFLPIQRKSGLKLKLHKAYVTDDIKIFEIVDQPKAMQLYKTFLKEIENKTKKKELFSLNWMNFGKEKEEREIDSDEDLKEKYKVYEERCSVFKKLNDYSDISNLKKYEITR